jgi:hypothetical protein
MQDTKKAKRIYTAQFSCTCSGCRNIPTRPAEIVYTSQIASKESETHFFSPNTMRFFNSRIVDYKPVQGASDIDSLSVIVSSKHGYEGSQRYYEIVILCPFGTVHRESKQFETLREARKSWDEIVSGFLPCECHGCVLDREYYA